MERTLEIKCDCGMVSHLVLDGGIYRYDLARHGNGEPANGRCFNCGKPLEHKDLPQPPRAEAVDIKAALPPEPEPEEPGEEIDFDTMNRKQLKKFADDHGIEIPAKIKKVKDIRWFIADAVAGTGS